MRGKIIHYNAAEGRGLVASDGTQLPFEIAQWRSDTAPGVNQAVEMTLESDTLVSLFRVTDEVLLKERAAMLANRVGTVGGAALQSLRESAQQDGSSPGNGLQVLGKPLLVAHGVFIASAVALSFVTISMGFGQKGVSLLGISEMAEKVGMSVGGPFWTWLAFASIALPLAWKSRWAWLALLLPLLATVKPFLDVMSAAQDAFKEMEGLMGSSGASKFAEGVLEMFDTGMGFWLCLASSLFIAGIGLKRVLLPPSIRHD